MDLTPTVTCSVIFTHGILPSILTAMNAKSILIGLVAAVVVIGMWLMGQYNGLVALSQEVDGQWAQVETQYQRRFDLIPNLVESTKGVLQQEQDVFGKIAEARQGYAGAQTPTDKVQAANQMESALARLLVIVESYPELKSNETVAGLMDELAGTENRISVERKRFNDVTRTYNTRVKTFPTVLLAGMFGYSEKPYFEAVEAAQQAPAVNLQLDEK